jgi:adenylate cyclase
MTSIKTENLAIVMTDMVGFTEATVQQSRLEIEHLLDTHNRILLPIVRRFKGRHVKSIGDALLLVFRSPTDAMLCAMAMQDALYEYNRSTPKDRQIHMRVGASLGEVRVTRHDIIGEPVNMTSRICNITVADDIYLSEALYMAMNKAEVPSQEVGWKELKGIPQPVRVYHIPRFAVPRLVPDVIAADDVTDLVYPYGGAHLTARGQDSRLLEGARELGREIGRGATGIYRSTWARIVLAVALLSPVALYVVNGTVKYVHSLPKAAPVQAPVAAEAPKPEAAPVETSIRPDTEAPRPAVRAPAPLPIPATPGFKRISDVEKAYKENRLSTVEYRRIVAVMRNDRDRELERIKRDYKSGRMTKDEYKERTKEIEQRYE